MNTPRRDFELPADSARVDAVVDEEFRFHLEERRSQLIADGMSPADADAEVARRFGDIETYRRETAEIDRRAIRAQRRAHFLSTLRQETVRASRLLTRDRHFSLVAILTLAVGLAVTMAMFAVLDTVVLRPLPYADPEELVAVLHPATVPGSGERRWGMSPGGYVHLREHSRTLTQIGIYRNYSSTVLGEGNAELARFAIATHSVLEALRARPLYGRLFDATDDTPAGPDVAVISAEYHVARFGGDPAVVGKVLETADGSYTILGVTQPGLTLPLPGPFADASDLAGFGVDVWVPMKVNAAGPFYNNHPNVGIARLAAGVDVETAQRELSGLLTRFPEWMPQAYSERFFKSYNFRIAPIPLREAVLGAQVPRVLWFLFAAVLLVLAAATANVGSLFLARIESRRRETTVRSALGASGTQMAAHFLAESLLITGLATGLALLLAAVAVRAMPLVAPRDIPRMHEVTLSAQSIGLGIVLGLALGLVLGVLPMLRRALDVSALRDGSRGLSASPRQRLVRHALVVAQIAVTMVLLTGAGTMMQSLRDLRAVDAGFSSDGTLTFGISLPFSGYDTREKALAYFRQLDERLRALPGVSAVSAGAVPLQDFGTGCSVVFREGRPYESGEQTPCVSTPSVLPGYFDALDITVSGAAPTWSDVDTRTQAVVVTQALAERLWPGEDPIGKGIASNGSDSDVWYRVTGVVPQLRAETLDGPPTEAVFYAATGLRANVRSGELNDLTVIVRGSEEDPLILLPRVRAVIKELDARVPLIAPRPMQEIVNRSIARPRFMLVLIGVAAAVALLLSAVGTYSVIAYLVAQRRSEIGIRMAIGAPARSVVLLVVGQSLRLALAGAIVGALAAVLGAKTLQSIVVGAAGSSAVLIASVAMLLVTVVLAASAAPARRAAMVEPVEAMRT